MVRGLSITTSLAHGDQDARAARCVAGEAAHLVVTQPSLAVLKASFLLNSTLNSLDAAAHIPARPLPANGCPTGQSPLDTPS